MRSMFAALRFLSILPVPRSWAGDERCLSGSVGFFAAAGLIMGAIAAGCVWLLGFWLPQSAVAAVAVVLIAVMTRGLHLDGLADTADGFWSVSDRQRTLEIMKDSFTGAMGVIAIASVLLLKFACLSVLGERMLWRGVLLMVLSGRCMMVLPISLFPYARKEGGLGKLFYEMRTVFNAVLAAVAVLAVGWFIAGVPGISAAAAAMVVTVAFSMYCKWKIGGVTGDTIGATCEIAEVVTVLVMCGSFGGQMV